jgi:hypothetical protein
MSRWVDPRGAAETLKYSSINGQGLGTYRYITARVGAKSLKDTMKKRVGRLFGGWAPPRLRNTTAKKLLVRDRNYTILPVSNSVIDTINYSITIYSISVSLGINSCATPVAVYLWRFGHGRIDGPGGSLPSGKLPPGELPPPFEPDVLFSICASQSSSKNHLGSISRELNIKESQSPSRRHMSPGTFMCLV